MERHEYTLQRYAGINSRHTCPVCGRHRCFTLYVDENGEPLHETVGRCDHESSCGYHYTPKEFFHDNPDFGKEDWRNLLRIPKSSRPITKQKALCTIQDEYLTRSVRTDVHSSFVSFLLTIMPEETVAYLIDLYRIGVTKSRDVIFFQIDVNGKLRTGKIMKYDPVTGHRIKDPDMPGRITWVHSLMKQKGLLDENWELSQCLFGEHLLPLRPTADIRLVESEKTAIICSIYAPQYIWLATGGKSQLNPEKLKVLQGRKVVAYPDLDAHNEWVEKFKAMPWLNVTVSDYLLKMAEPDELCTNMDLADYLLKHAPRGTEMKYAPGIEPEPIKKTAMEYVFDCISPEYHEQVKALIDELGLVPVSIKRTE